MKDYELKYSQFLADISSKVADFIKNNYFFENISKNSVYTNQEPINVKQEDVIETQEPEIVNDIDTFENVDNDKVELVDFNQSKKDNKVLLYVIGAIILYSLLRR